MLRVSVIFVLAIHIFVSDLAPAWADASQNPVPIMVMDGGFNLNDLERENFALALRFQRRVLSSIFVPSGDGATIDLIDANRLGALIYQQAEKPASHNHAVAVSVMASEPITEKIHTATDPLIPVLDPIAQIAAFLDGHEREIADLETFLPEYFLALDQIIKGQGIRIVVRTMLGSKTGIAGLCAYIAGPRCTDRLIKLISDGFQNLVTANPQTIFIMAAGNESEMMSETVIPEFSAFQNPNVLVVGAVADDGLALTDYSSWHPDIVRLVALGGPSEELGPIGMSGTSFAAPRVARRLRELIRHQPEVSAFDAITRLFHTFTYLEPLLDAHVAQGRVLRDKYTPSPHRCSLFLRERNARRSQD